MTRKRIVHRALRDAVAPLVDCKCSKCGRVGKTRRPRPDYLCVRCFIERDLGRPLTADDVKVGRK